MLIINYLHTTLGFCFDRGVFCSKIAHHDIQTSSFIIVPGLLQGSRIVLSGMCYSSSSCSSLDSLRDVPCVVLHTHLQRYVPMSSSPEIPYKTHKGRQCIDQKAANEFWDGEQKFKFGDKHPTIEGLFYRMMCRKRPYWFTLEQLEARREANRKWHKANPERHAANVRKWAKANTEKIATKNLKWKKTNPEKVAVSKARYRASKYENDIDEFGNSTRTRKDDKFYAQCRAHARRLTECLGVDFQINHVFPLNNKGSHRAGNFQVIPAKLNHQICDRHAIRWGAPYGLKENVSAFDNVIAQ